ncbi:MAG TPA: pyridoxal-phosphate dependent enzyme [Thermoleophilaceae bacterium]|nr:pyridoxal-phosphate dependent enzyme [Thermoleophilaceae bacterium]
MIGLDDVRAAAERLEGVAHRTPVFHSHTLDERVGARVLIKAECFQRTGSFKFRGAYNKISSLSDEERGRGVVAFSSGNHAQAVALAARLLGAQATIVMPQDAPALKLEATRGYGAEVVLYDRYTEDREAIGGRLAEDRGLSLVRPFDDPLVIAGQGTAALELLDEAGEVDLLLTPVGGGGLIAGCATVVAPRARVVGVEPEAGDDTRRSLDAGERLEIPVPKTIADALQITKPGELTFEHNRRLLDGVVTVTDDELIDAMKFLFERMKLVGEPGGVAGIAALLAGKVDAEGTVGVVLSGGNVGAARFAELLATRP